MVYFSLFTAGNMRGFFFDIHFDNLIPRGKTHKSMRLSYELVLLEFLTLRLGHVP
jgi:hypothetical protein